MTDDDLYRLLVVRGYPQHEAAHIAAGPHPVRQPDEPAPATNERATVLADLRASYGQLCDPGCHGRCRVCPADAVTAAIAFIEAQQSPEQATERSARRDVETGMEMAGSQNGQPPEPSEQQTLAAARYDWLKRQFRVMSPHMDGQHHWSLTGHSQFKGGSIDAICDAGIARCTTPTKIPSLPHKQCKTPDECRREQICLDAWHCSAENGTAKP